MYYLLFALCLIANIANGMEDKSIEIEHAAMSCVAPIVLGRELWYKAVCFKSNAQINFADSLVHNDKKYAVIVTPTGMHLYDLKTLTHVSKSTIPYGFTQNACFDPKKLLFISNRQHSSIFVFNMQTEDTKKFSCRRKKHYPLIQCFNTDKTGSLLALTSDNPHDGRIDIYNTQKGRKISSIKKCFQVQYLSFNDDGKKMITASLDKSACIWDWSNRKKLLETRHMLPVVQAYLGKKELIFVTVARGISGYDQIYVWDVIARKQLSFIQCKKTRVHNVFFSPDDHRLMVICHNGDVLMLDLQSNILSEKGNIGGVCYFSDLCNAGRRVVTASEGGHVTTWDMCNGKKIAHIFISDSCLLPNRVGVRMSRSENKMFVTQEAKEAWMWKRYKKYTLNQVWFLNNLYTWFLLQKPSKKITSRRLLLEHVADDIYCHLSDLRAVWKSFPSEVRITLWELFSKTIQTYGK